MTAVDYRAKQDWLRTHPYGAGAQAVRNDLRLCERELKNQGKTIEKWLESERVQRRLTAWYVSANPKTGRPYSHVRHASRDCHTVADISDKYVREATEDEIRRMPTCAYCG